MATDEGSSIQTRPSPLNRLKTGDDAGSWQEFYRIYGKLVRDFVLQAGLTDTEADEVVQETAIGIARHLPEYRYDPCLLRERPQGTIWSRRTVHLHGSLAR